MMLRAAFVPPDDAVERLRALSGRLAALPGVSAAGPSAVDVPIAALGNVVETDAERFASLLAERLAGFAPVTVRPAGIETKDGDLTVRLDGDLDTLAAVAQAVGTAAERIHVYVDRRGFRPAVVVGSVVAGRAGSPLDRLLSGPDVLGEFAGTTWAVAEVDLVRIRWFGGEARAETAYRIPFGVAHAALPGRGGTGGPGGPGLGFGGRDFSATLAATPLE